MSCAPATVACLFLALSLHAADVVESKVFTAGGTSIPYVQVQIGKLAKGTKVPVVFFLHGAGERGDGNGAQLNHIYNGNAGLGRPSQSTPCLLIAPQCPANGQWVDVPWSNGSYTQPAISPALDLALQLIDSIAAAPAVDTNRISIVGLSMGGYGTWDAIARRPGFFAAAVPCCGAGDLAFAKALTTLPIWAFHGAKDDIVPASGTRDMIAAITAAGGKPKYTEYPHEGHGSWGPAFADDAMWDWLFAQKRAPAKKK